MDEYDVVSRLAALGIKRSWLEEATRQGELERRFTSPLEFPGAAAYKAASRGLEVIRDMSKADGWAPVNFLGIPVAMNELQNVAIGVTEGDGYTGVFGEKDPATRALKGPNNKKIADANRLFDLPVDFFYLLTASVDGLLLAELSAPLAMAGGHISKWTERILLGEIEPFSGQGVPSQPVQPTASPEVSVIRKSS